MTRGTRRIGGRCFILAGRGSKTSCQREADALRLQWKYVRILPADPFASKSFRDALDDWMLYVFEQRADGR